MFIRAITYGEATHSLTPQNNINILVYNAELHIMTSKGTDNSRRGDIMKQPVGSYDIIDTKK